MEPIGAKLREARERKGMTLQEAKRELRIHGPYLEALEAGEFAKLPAPAYARAFLRQYAAFLGLDPQPLVDAYNAHAGNTPPALDVGWTAAPETRPGWGSWTATLVVGILLGLGLVGAYEVRSYLVGKEEVRRQAALQARRHAATPRKPAITRQPAGVPLATLPAQPGSNQPSPPATTARPPAAAQTAPGSAPSSSTAVAAGSRPAGSAPSPTGGGLPVGTATTSAPTATAPGKAQVSGGASQLPAGRPDSSSAPLAPGTDGLDGLRGAQGPSEIGAAASADGTPTAPSGSGVQVTIVAQERCWVRVRSDGRTVFSGSLVPGEARNWQGSDAVGITLGNAGGVRVSVNGRDVGAMGRPGQVVHRVFRAAAPGSGI